MWFASLGTVAAGLVIYRFPREGERDRKRDKQRDRERERERERETEREREKGERYRDLEREREGVLLATAWWAISQISDSPWGD